MAGMFCSKQEAAEKLNMTEEQIEGLVTEGKLREFSHAGSVLFKVDEVQALMSGAGVAPSGETVAEPEKVTEPELVAEPEQVTEPEPVAEPESAAGADEISLASETAAGDELLDGDTVLAGEGTSLPGDTVDDIKAAGDVLEGTAGGMGTGTGSGEASLEEIEEDVNLDTFGSGSGLLDLSLQADDTSLGGILDEIYTAEEGQETREGSAVEVSPVEEQMIPEEEFAAPEPAPDVSALAPVYVEPDTLSNAFGIMLFLPLLAILYTAIVAVAGFNNVMPAILGTVQGMSGPYGVHMIWYIMIVVAVVAALIIGVAFMLSKKGGKAGKKKAAIRPEEVVEQA